MQKKQKRKPPPRPDQLSLLEYQDRVSRLLQETDSDPDYTRHRAIFAQLSKELDQC